jgi:16S rRNA (cytosine967-C5)-methyltransferase
MPEWLVKHWMEEYDIGTVEKMLESFLKISKTTIRAQLNNGSAADLKESLERDGAVVEDGSILPEALKISGYDYLERLTAFEEGKFQVQDESSMLVGRLAAPEEGMLVVDVCSAPGGKSLHMADLMHGTGTVIARDVTDYKADLIIENKNRLHSENVTVQVFDALTLDPDLIGKADIVIADLPCSGLGIIGKKHDIKYNMTKDQMLELAKLQREILSVVVKYVKPNGILMYSTCTIHKEENVNNMRWMVENLNLSPVAFDTLMPEGFNIETAKEGYIQLIPGVHPCDGFFIAKLRKKC